MKRAITILLMLGTIVLNSCITEYVESPLPDFSPIRPERPELEKVEEEVPIGTTLNLVKVIGYAELLEIYADNWENFYRIIQEERNE